MQLTIDDFVALIVGAVIFGYGMDIIIITRVQLVGKSKHQIYNHTILNPTT